MAKPRQNRPPVGVPDVGRNNVPIIVGAVVAVLVVAVIAVVLTRNSGDEASPAADTIEWQDVTVTGEPLPSYSDDNSNNVNEAVGQTAPELRGKNFTSQPVVIGNDGRAKAVVFLAHWCPHCQKELPLISDWLKANRSKYPTVDFYGVATATDNRRPNFPPSDWIAKEGFSGTVLVDDRANEASSAFGLTGYPFMVFLDKDNKVVSRTSGELPMDQFEQRVSALVAQ